HENHQATFDHGQFLDHARQAQVINGRNLHPDATDDHAHQVALVERGDTETADPARRDGEVAFLGFNEILALLFGHHAEHDVARHVRGQCRLGDRHHLAVDLHRGRYAGGNEQVGAAFLHHDLEEVFKFHLLAIP